MLKIIPTSKYSSTRIFLIGLLCCLSACSPVNQDTQQEQMLEKTEEVITTGIPSNNTVNAANAMNMPDRDENSNKDIETSSPMIADVESSNELQATIIGEFSGKMRCADCSFNKIYLQLNTDGTAEKILFHTAQKDMNTYKTIKGTYTQHKDIITIKFNKNPLHIEQELYKLEDHYLVQLTNELKVPTNTILVQD